MDQSAEDRMRSHYLREWTRTVADYHARPNDLYRSWWYLATHPIMCDEVGSSIWDEALDIHIARVNPSTREIDDDKSLNTHTEVWLECGPVEFPFDEPTRTMATHHQLTHDIRLDTGGDTFEEAIVNMAALVAEVYGDDRARVYDEHLLTNADPITIVQG